MAINLLRSPRECRFYPHESVCGAGVGPGTYEVRTAIPGTIEEGCVPFSSLQDKIPPNRSTAAMTPGPGAYEIIVEEPGPRKKRLPEAQFRSKSARIGPGKTGANIFSESDLVRNPGVGTYSLDAPWAEPVGTVPKRSAPVLELTKTQASIPGARVVLKDEEDEGKEENFDMAPLAEPKTRAANFHVSASNRKIFEPSCHIENKLPSRVNPGPGAYKSNDLETFGMGQKSVFVSKTLMCHQRVSEPPPELPLQASLRKKLDDGPAAANMFDSQVQRNCWARNLDQPFKDSYAVRCVPGPGTYYSGEEPERVEPVRKKVHGIHHPNIKIALNEITGPLHAFNTTDIRPCNKTQKSEFPPPGAYNIDQQVGASMNAVIQEKALVGKKGVFGTTADRFFRSQFDGVKKLFNATGGVDIRSYDLQEKPVKEDPNKSSVMFQSATKRFEEDETEEPTKPGRAPRHQYPGPQHYHPDIDINYRSPFRHPRTEHLSFGSSKARFDAKEVFNGVQYSHIPGPGEYNLHSKKKAPGGVGIRSKRMGSTTLGATKETVGPGSYEIMGSMMKKSFNVSGRA